MKIAWSWIVSFGLFWYRFIVGDDWTVAASVAVSLVVTAMLRTMSVPAWWLVPIVVVAIVGISLQRASPTRNGPKLVAGQTSR